MRRSARALERRIYAAAENSVVRPSTDRFTFYVLRITQHFSLVELLFPRKREA
jgi:hypothetical protein